ncbi:MAG: hypothetical protein MHM6MM_007893, partial [Cercozoa sp. M6MM]
KCLDAAPEIRGPQPEEFGLDPLAVAKFGEFILNAFPDAKAVTVAVLSGLPVDCVRHFIWKEVGYSAILGEAAYNASFSYWLRRVNARRFSDNPDDAIWSALGAIPEELEVREQRLLEYDERANPSFAQLLAGLYFDEGQYNSAVWELGLRAPAQVPFARAGVAVASGMQHLQRELTIVPSVTQCSFRDHMRSYVRARFEALNQPTKSPDIHHLTDSRTRLIGHSTDNFFFSASSMAYMMGMLPVKVEAMRSVGKSTTQLMEETKGSAQLLPPCTLLPSLRIQQPPSVRTSADFGRELVAGLPSFALPGRDTCGLTGGILVHRVIATAARMVGLSDSQCRVTRNSANTALGIMEHLHDALNTRIGDLSNRLPPRRAPESSTEAAATAEPDPAALRDVDIVENVLRVVGSSTSVENVRALGFGAEGLSSVTSHVSIVDPCLAAVLADLPRSIRPELQAPKAPLFELAMKALIKRRDSYAFALRLQSLAIQEALPQQTADDVARAQLAETQRIATLQHAVTQTVLKHSNEEEANPVECELFGLTQGNTRVAVLGCFQQSARATENRVYNLFTLSDENIRSMKDTFEGTQGWVTLLQLNDSGVLTPVTASVEYAVGMMRGVDSSNSFVHNRLFLINDQGEMRSLKNPSGQPALRLQRLTIPLDMAVTDITTFVHLCQSELADYTKEEHQLPSAVLAWAFACARSQIEQQRQALHASLSRSVSETFAPPPSSTLKTAVIDYLEIPPTKPQEADELLEPIRQAYRMDKQTIAQELRSAHQDFRAGGDASKSGEQFLFTEHYVVKTVKQKRDRGFFEPRVLQPYVEHLVEIRGQGTAALAVRRKQTFFAPVLSYMYLRTQSTYVAIMLNVLSPREDDPACQGAIFDVKGVSHFSSNPVVAQKSPLRFMQREKELVQLLSQRDRQPLSFETALLPSHLALPKPDQRPARHHHINDQALQQDLQFLRGKGVMDYSMLFALRLNTLQTETGQDVRAMLQPSVCRVAIIDYFWIAGVVL